MGFVIFDEVLGESNRTYRVAVSNDKVIKIMDCNADKNIVSVLLVGGHIINVNGSFEEVMNKLTEMETSRDGKKK